MTKIRDLEIRDWLLRRLDAQRSAALEQQLFVDAELADRIDGVECDLIDDCAHGSLPAADARIVRARDAWRARFAKALVELKRSATTPAPSASTRARTLRRVGFSAAISALLLVLVGVTFRWQEIPPTRMAQTVDTASLPVVTLLAERRRSIAAPLALPVYSGDVRIQAEIDGAATNASSRYALSVAEGGRILFIAHGLAPRTAGPYRFVEAIVSADLLGPDARRVVVTEEPEQDSSASSWDVQMPSSR